jgi:phosphopantothenoylcysteine decarboxylase/phosphopantothenate--cysteine ligase
MGFAMAHEAQARGAEVTMICGPTELHPPAGVRVVPVTTAREMHDAVMEHLPGISIFVGAAAVADFRPAQFASRKIRKADAASTVVLEPNPDVIAEVAGGKSPGCFVLGFAAETEDAEEHAREKLQAKKLDCIVTNRIGMSGGAFGAADNEVVILWGNAGRQAVPRASKAVVAAAIWDRVAALRSPSRPATA